MPLLCVGLGAEGLEDVGAHEVGNGGAAGLWLLVAPLYCGEALRVRHEADAVEAEARHVVVLAEGADSAVAVALAALLPLWAACADTAFLAARPAFPLANRKHWLLTIGLGMLLSAVWALKGPAARRQTFALPLLSLPLSLSLAIPRSASFPSEALECCDEVLDVRRILEVEGLVVPIVVLDAVNG